MQPRFVLTGHAVQRFIDRVCPDIGFIKARSLLGRLTATAVRIPVPPNAKHHEWRIQDPHCVLVCLATGDDEYTITTVLGPGEKARPALRTVLPSDDAHTPKPPDRLKKRRYKRARMNDHGRPDAGEWALAELYAAEEERVLLGPTPAQREAGGPTLAQHEPKAAPEPVQAPPTLTKEEKAARGQQRADMLAEYKRRAEGVKMVCAMVGFGQVSLDDCDSALRSLADCLEHGRQLFAGKTATLAQLEGTYRHAANRVAGVRAFHAARQREATEREAAE